MSLTELSEKYSISKSILSMINQGKIWKDKTQNYPIRNFSYGSPGEKNPRSKFTE